MNRDVQPTFRAEDWTRAEDGRSNSSEAFRHLCDEIEWLIRSDAHSLLDGRADQTARLILAQLAHVHGLAPHISDPPQREEA